MRGNEKRRYHIKIVTRGPYEMIVHMEGMDAADLNKLKKRIMAKAACMGFSEMAEDLAHEVILRMIENPRHETRAIKFMLIDAIRQMMGDSRYLQNQIKTVSIDNLPIPDPAPSQLIDLELGRLDAMARSALLLSAIWGLTGQEIAIVLGTTDMKISKLLSNTRSTLKLPK
jgi:DNA-directed RNA polymerase specialized sigma24 family protein